MVTTVTRGYSQKGGRSVFGSKVTRGFANKSHNDSQINKSKILKNNRFLARELNKQKEEKAKMQQTLNILLNKRNDQAFPNDTIVEIHKYAMQVQDSVRNAVQLAVKFSECLQQSLSGVSSIVAALSRIQTNKSKRTPTAKSKKTVQGHSVLPMIGGLAIHKPNIQLRRLDSAISNSNGIVNLSDIAETEDDAPIQDSSLLSEGNEHENVETVEIDVASAENGMLPMAASEPIAPPARRETFVLQRPPMVILHTPLRSSAEGKSATVARWPRVYLKDIGGSLPSGTTVYEAEPCDSADSIHNDSHREFLERIAREDPREGPSSMDDEVSTEHVEPTKRFSRDTPSSKRKKRGSSMEMEMKKVRQTSLKAAPSETIQVHKDTSDETETSSFIKKTPARGSDVINSATSTSLQDETPKSSRNSVVTSYDDKLSDSDSDCVDITPNRSQQSSITSSHLNGLKKSGAEDSRSRSNAKSKRLKSPKSNANTSPKVSCNGATYVDARLVNDEMEHKKKSTGCGIKRKSSSKSPPTGKQVEKVKSKKSLLEDVHKASTRDSKKNTKKRRQTMKIRFPFMGHESVKVSPSTSPDRQNNGLERHSTFEEHISSSKSPVMPASSPTNIQELSEDNSESKVCLSTPGAHSTSVQTIQLVLDDCAKWSRKELKKRINATSDSDACMDRKESTASCDNADIVDLAADSDASEGSSIDMHLLKLSRPRRNRPVVSLKEPSLNKKMRRD